MAQVQLGVVRMVSMLLPSKLFWRCFLVLSLCGFASLWVRKKVCFRPSQGAALLLSICVGDLDTVRRKICEGCRLVRDEPAIIVERKSQSSRVVFGSILA